MKAGQSPPLMPWESFSCFQPALFLKTKDTTHMDYTLPVDGPQKLPSVVFAHLAPPAEHRDGRTFLPSIGSVPTPHTPSWSCFWSQGKKLRWKVLSLIQNELRARKGDRASRDRLLGTWPQKKLVGNKTNGYGSEENPTLNDKTLPANLIIPNVSDVALLREEGVAGGEPDSGELPSGEVKKKHPPSQYPRQREGPPDSLMGAGATRTHWAEWGTVEQQCTWWLPKEQVFSKGNLTSQQPTP